MFKKLATSFMLASVLVGVSVVPSIADTAKAKTSSSDDTFQTVCFFPVRVVGCAVGAVVGVPLGAVKDGVKGAQMSTKWVAGKMGDENGQYQTWTGYAVGAPFGAVGGGLYGVFDGALHGLKTGYDKPFSREAFNFKED